MPPRSATKIDVGIVSWPGCSKTIRGLTFSPSTSQIALPNAFAPPNQSFHSARVPRRRHAPVRELLAVDEPDRAERRRVLALLLAAHDGDRSTAGVGDQLDGERTEPAARAPHQHDVAGLHRVRRPAEEHPVGGRAREGGGRGLLPRQEVGLGQALVRLHLRELRERAPARVVAPHAERRRQAGVLARLHPRIVLVPLAGVHDDAVAHLDVRDLVAHRVHDAARIRADDVEVGGLTPPRLRLRDVDRDPARRPDVVEVDAGGHHQHERIVRPELGHVDDLVLDRLLGLAVAVGTHQLRVHLRRHLADRRDLADLVQVLAHGSHLFRRCRRTRRANPSKP